MLSPQRGVSMLAQTAQVTNSVLKNDDHCNVRKEAISRDVENASRQKVGSHQNEAINANRRTPTTCSRVFKSLSQEYGRVSSRIFKSMAKCVPDSQTLELLKRVLSVRECEIEKR